MCYGFSERPSAGGKKSSTGKGGANGKGKESAKVDNDAERPRGPGAAANAATAALLSKLESTDPQARTAALEELHPLAARVDRIAGKLAQGGAPREPKIAGLTPSLVKAAVDPVESIRLLALYALADARDAEGAAALRDRVSDPSKKVRFTAACLLTEFHDASGLDELRKALTAMQAHLATTPLAEVEQLLSALQRITGKSFGDIPTLPPEGPPRAAVAAQYLRLLDTWAAWWDWVPPNK
jgi:HEAT repeat protein